MGLSADAVEFAMQVGPAGRQVEGKAVLTVTQSKGFKGRQGWRAIIRPHGKKRLFGSWRLSFVESVRAWLMSNSHRVSESEQDRLLKLAPDMQSRKLAPDMQSRRTAVLNTTAANPVEVVSQALSQAPVDAHAPSQGHVRQNAVRLVHQVYGLFGDDKPMSSLFSSSHKAWKEVAALMSAHYHLWTADDVEALVKQKYPQHWDMYRSVRYPIMRADIARLLILHAYGGLYADLDTIPNRQWYEQTEFALARVKDPKRTTMSGKAKRKSAHGSQPRELGRGRYLEMEIIVSTRGNAIFHRWLDYISTQIATKVYGGGKKIFLAKCKDAVCVPYNRAQEYEEVLILAQQ